MSIKYIQRPVNLKSFFQQMPQNQSKILMKYTSNNQIQKKNILKFGSNFIQYGLKVGNYKEPKSKYDFKHSFKIFMPITVFFLLYLLNLYKLHS